MGRGLGALSLTVAGTALAVGSWAGALVLGGGNALGAATFYFGSKDARAKSLKDCLSALASFETALLQLLEVSDPGWSGSART